MNFLPGFTWALPEAFSDAVAKCRFEEGDMMYDSKSVYGDEWGKAIGTATACIKVRSPRRSAGKALEKNESVFLANWKSDVVIELINLADCPPNSRFIETTQGRLFTFLWKGNKSVLDKNSENPEKPLILKDVRERLNKLFNAGQWRKIISKSRPLAEDNDHFILAYDPTHALSREKHISICNALGKSHDGAITPETVEGLGFKDWRNISPVISLNLYSFKKNRLKDIEKLLEKDLYTGSGKGGFRLHTHGIFKI